MSSEDQSQVHTWNGPSGLVFKMGEYGRLMRLDRPIGSLLLLAPTLWGVWVATAGRPDALLLFVFVAGVFVMRSAGCVMNDLADRNFDPHVERTRDRPLAAKTVSITEAVGLCLFLCLVALVLLSTLPRDVIVYALAAIAVTACYPFVKRFVHTPQIVLGIAFSFGIPMAFAARQGGVPLEGWVLVLANVFWTIAYDTEYAMADREDDLKIGVKSTAILLGRNDCIGVAILQALAVVTLGVVGALLELNAWYLAMLTISSLTFVYQYYLIRDRDRGGCFRAFLNNAWFGLLVWGGLVLAYL